jgi:hypothetical protein
MNTVNLMQACELWAAGVIPALNTFDHAPRSISEALPVVVADIQTDRVANADAGLPGLGDYQQTYLRARSVDLLILVAPTPAWTAAQVLYGYVDALGEALQRDRRLGNRVEAASPFYEASYDPPEVEYEDGTIARQVTFRIVAGETISIGGT